MKIKLNEALKSYDMFIKEDDGVSVEADVQVATQDLDTVIVSKDSIIADVDHIITSLETLAGQVQEMVDSLDSEAVNEVDAGTALLHWAVTGPKAMKAQAKVNQMKINLQDLQFARDNADSKNKESLKAKAEAVKNKVDDAQKTVADKFDSKSDIVKGMRLKKKLEGDRELIKRLTGMEDDPKKKAELKDQLSKIVAREKEQTMAIKELKPDEANDEDAVKKAKEEASKEEPKKSEEAPKEEPKKEDSTEDKIAKVEADIKDYGKNIDDTNQAIRDNETKVKKMEAEKEKSTDPEKIQADIEGIKKRIEADKEVVKDMQSSRNNLKKELAKLSPKEQLAVRADLIGLNEMAIEIMGKEDWQFENNSVLYNKYNAIITKAEAAEVLNESRYFNNSIKDAFSKLI